MEDHRGSYIPLPKMQVAPQQTQNPPSETSYTEPSSTSRRQYASHSPQQADVGRVQSSTKAANSPQSSRRTPRRPSGNASQEPTTSAQYQSPTGSYPTVSSAQRGPDVPNNSGTSPIASSTATSSPYQSRREQRPQQDAPGGPPIPPPPRTSSNQKNQNTSLPSTAPLTDRTVHANSARDRPASSRGPRTKEPPAFNDRDGGPAGAPVTANDMDPTNDATTAAAAVARSRRKGPASPEMPQRARSHREPGAQQSPATVQSRSVSNVATNPPIANSIKDESQIINRVVVTDPQIDIAREQERQAEAVPGLDTAGNQNIDTSGEASVQRRQDHSASAGRRKETKFGDYVLGQTLGEGEFGKVKLGWKKDGSVQVAIKLIRLEALGSNPSRLPKIHREISILRELSHPNIVRLHEMVETKSVIGIILEYASGGELFDYILNQRYLKDNSARRLFAQLVSGVGYLHKKGIVHRDLKLENLLLDRNRNIIITDFGFAIHSIPAMS